MTVDRYLKVRIGKKASTEHFAHIGGTEPKSGRLYSADFNTVAGSRLALDDLPVEGPMAASRNAISDFLPGRFDGDVIGI